MFKCTLTDTDIATDIIFVNNYLLNGAKVLSKYV